MPQSLFSETDISLKAKGSNCDCLQIIVKRFSLSTDGIYPLHFLFHCFQLDEIGEEEDFDEEDGIEKAAKAIVDMSLFITTKVKYILIYLNKSVTHYNDLILVKVGILQK